MFISSHHYYWIFCVFNADVGWSFASKVTWPSHMHGPALFGSNWIRVSRYFTGWCFGLFVNQYELATSMSTYTTVHFHSVICKSNGRQKTEILGGSGQHPLACHLSGGDFLFGLERFDEVQRYQECWSCRKSKCLVMLIETRKKLDTKEMAMERETETETETNIFWNEMI